MMASPLSSEELPSVAVVCMRIQNGTDLCPYVTLCGVVNIRINTAFENILSNVKKMLWRET